MADETATVRLYNIESPPPQNLYLYGEWERIRDDQDHLASVAFRVNVDRDVFSVRALLDRRHVPDDRLIPEARRCAVVILRAALHALEAHEAPGEAPESLGGLP